jgi:hypothetical protein
MVGDGRIGRVRRIPSRAARDMIAAERGPRVLTGPAYGNASPERVCVSIVVGKNLRIML